MSTQAQTPAESLANYVSAQQNLSHVCVAFSGGMDSHVLLHTAANLFSGDPTVALRAVHVNHGLQADSEHWVSHCLLYTSPSPRDLSTSRMPSSA